MTERSLGSSEKWDPQLSRWIEDRIFEFDIFNDYSFDPGYTYFVITEDSFYESIFTDESFQNFLRMGKLHTVHVDVDIITIMNASIHEKTGKIELDFNKCKYLRVAFEPKTDDSVEVELQAICNKKFTKSWQEGIVKYLEEEMTKK